MLFCQNHIYKVTLHVSVWVEIYLLRHKTMTFQVTLHVSVWVEIKIVATLQLFKQSRSTWACELKFTISLNFVSSALSRSTWACELKCIICTVCSCHWSHAPRERVSWNSIFKVSGNFSTASRSTWACELKCKSVQQHFGNLLSRSTWACELKWPHGRVGRYSQRGHAPRERVSWNVWSAMLIRGLPVTLHVSVWVEIKLLWN